MKAIIEFYKRTGGWGLGIKNDGDIIPLGRFSFISNLLDRTIFNPVLTTRIAQTVKGLGQKTGQTPLRQILRAGTIIKTREALENK